MSGFQYPVALLEGYGRRRQVAKGDGPRLGAFQVQP